MIPFKTSRDTFLFILIFILAMIINPIAALGQPVVNIRANGYTVENQAEGQTNWMTRRLILDDKLAKAVYQINLKYLLQSDSLRLTTTETINKRTLHLAITQKKNSELQSVLSPEQYSKYLAIFANAKRYSL